MIPLVILAALECQPGSPLRDCVDPVALAARFSDVESEFKLLDAAHYVKFGDHWMVVRARMKEVGWWSVTYLGEEEETGLPIILKVRRAPKDPKRQPNYQAECDRLKELEGAGGLPRCYGVGVSPVDPPWPEGGDPNMLQAAIALERVPGQSLAEAFPNPLRPRPGGKAVRIARSLLSQVAEIHAKGFTHRDVRWRNARLVRKQSRTVRLIDIANSGPAEPGWVAQDTRDAAMVLVQLLSEDEAVRANNYVSDEVVRAAIDKLPPAMQPLAPVLRQAFDRDGSKRFATPAALERALAPFERLPDP